jgi:hypothetical protein
MKVAVLDDYQNVALQLATGRASGATPRSPCSTTTLPIPRQWSSACGRSTWYASCANARCSLGILQQLPNLKLIASTGPRNASIDTQTAADLGIAVPSASDIRAAGRRRCRHASAVLSHLRYWRRFDELQICAHLRPTV